VKMPLLVYFRLSLKGADRMEISRLEMIQMKMRAVLVCPTMSLASLVSLAADGLLMACLMNEPLTAPSDPSSERDWMMERGGHSLPIHHLSLHTHFLLQFLYHHHWLWTRSSAHIHTGAVTVRIGDWKNKE